MRHYIAELFDVLSTRRCRFHSHRAASNAFVVFILDGSGGGEPCYCIEKYVCM